MIFRILLMLGISLPLFSATQGKFEQALDLFLKFLTLSSLYLMFFVLISIISGRLALSRPRLADRLALLSNWLLPNLNHRITRLAIHKNNPAVADQIWSEISPRLGTLKPGTALALATNYSSSLSNRGQYSRARNLLLELDPSKASKAYRLFVTLYWLNLGFYHFQLGQFQEARNCLSQATREPVKHPALRERCQGLEILLARQPDVSEALRLLRQHDRKRAFAALMLAELGHPEEAARRLPEAASLSDPWELKCYHLARMWLAETPESKRQELQFASQLPGAHGLVAWQALTHLQDPSYLEKARRDDAESIWTRQAEGLV
jgi:tetratricopeptide (TPR) repeat protein